MRRKSCSMKAADGIKDMFMDGIADIEKELQAVSAEIAACEARRAALLDKAALTHPVRPGNLVSGTCRGERARFVCMSAEAVWTPPHIRTHAVYIRMRKNSGSRFRGRMYDEAELEDIRVEDTSRNWLLNTPLEPDMVF